MYKSAFQGLKRTLMHFSGLPLPYFDIKNEFVKNLVFHLKAFEQSHLKAKYAIVDSTLRAHNYRVGNFNFVNYL